MYALKAPLSLIGRYFSIMKFTLIGHVFTMLEAASLALLSFGVTKVGLWEIEIESEMFNCRKTKFASSAILHAGLA